jgi:hypothetical protein
LWISLVTFSSSLFYTTVCLLPSSSLSECSWSWSCSFSLELSPLLAWLCFLPLHFLVSTSSYATGAKYLIGIIVVLYSLNKLFPSQFSLTILSLYFTRSSKWFTFYFYKVSLIFLDSKKTSYSTLSSWSSSSSIWDYPSWFWADESSLASSSFYNSAFFSSSCLTINSFLYYIACCLATSFSWSVYTSRRSCVYPSLHTCSSSFSVNGKDYWSSAILSVFLLGLPYVNITGIGTKLPRSTLSSSVSSLLGSIRIYLLKES